MICHAHLLQILPISSLYSSAPSYHHKLILTRNVIISVMAIWNRFHSWLLIFKKISLISENKSLRKHISITRLPDLLWLSLKQIVCCVRVDQAIFGIHPRPVAYNPDRFLHCTCTWLTGNAKRLECYKHKPKSVQEKLHRPTVNYRTSWSSSWNSCYVFWRSRVQISTRRLTILTRFLWFSSVPPSWDKSKRCTDTPCWRQGERRYSSY
jgi:hypothetical protein